MKMLEKIMGPGLAAPETRRVRYLRWTVIALSTLVCGGLVSIGIITALIGAVVTGGLFGLLLIATLSVGALYFLQKVRRDDAWLDERCRTRGDD